MNKILVLGNEFIAEDALAKKVGDLLKKEYTLINIKDSFQLMSLLQNEKNPTILDVVKGLQGVRIIDSERLKTRSIISAHDFDASQVIKLIGKPVTIIGIPQQGDLKEILKEVKNLLE